MPVVMSHDYFRHYIYINQSSPKRKPHIKCHTLPHNELETGCNTSRLATSCYDGPEEVNVSCSFRHGWLRVRFSETMAAHYPCTPNSQNNNSSETFILGTIYNDVSISVVSASFPPSTAVLQCWVTQCHWVGGRRRLPRAIMDHFE